MKPLDAKAYLEALRTIKGMLPTVPPKAGWTKEVFREALPLVRAIEKKLAVVRQPFSRDFQRQEFNWLDVRREVGRDQRFIEARRLKEIEKTVRQHPRVVKEYLVALLNYRVFLKLAVASAERGWFAPESFGLLQTKHAELQELQQALESYIDAT